MTGTVGSLSACRRLEVPVVVELAELGCRCRSRCGVDLSAAAASSSRGRLSCLSLLLPAFLDDEDEDDEAEDDDDDDDAAEDDDEDEDSDPRRPLVVPLDGSVRLAVDCRLCVDDEIRAAALLLGLRCP